MGSTVLLLDAQRLYRELLAHYFAAHGLTVVAAADAAEAANRMRETPAHIVVMDIDLPGGDGLDFIRRLRHTPATAAVPAIILTNIRTKEIVIRAAALGVREYILKHCFSADGLLERVRQLLAQPLTPPVAAVVGGPNGTGTIETPPPARNIPPVSGAASTSGAVASAGAALRPAAALPKAREKPTPPPSRPADAAPPQSAWPRLLTREKTLERLDAVAGGKTIAGVVAQVIAVANSASAELSDVVRVIQSDPLLASRVLSLANSAATGSRTRVSNIADAARAIGVRGIQNMAITIGIFGTFPPSEGDGFNSMRCWQHSFAVASLMAHIVRQRHPEQEGLSHLVGLCHDLGEILLRQHFQEEHEKILAYALEHRLPPNQVESVALGIRHPELISRLLTKIGLPPGVVDAIREFYERQVREHAAGLSAGAQLLNLANTLAHGLHMAASTHESVRPITRSEWRILSPDKPPPPLDARAKRDEILTSTCALARLPARDEQRMLAPLIERKNCRIAYVRPETFIDLDPLGFALDLLCDIEIFATLPPPETLKTFDGLAMAALRPGAAPVVPAELSRLLAAAGRPDLPLFALVTQDVPGSPPLPSTGCIAQYVQTVSLNELAQWVTEVDAARELAAANLPVAA